MFERDSFFMVIGIYIVGVFIVLFGIFFIMFYKSSCVSAVIYNQQNNTEYTCGDFFWAQNQINSQTQTIKLK